MNATIPPVNLPSVSNPIIDKVVNGTIENIPPEVSNVKPTDSVLLKAIMESNAEYGKSLFSNVKLIINNQPLETPVKVNIEQRLNLPPENEIAIKITGKAENNLQFKITSINNESPEKFLIKPDGVTTSRPTSSIINNIGAAKESTTFSMGSVEKLVANLIKDIPMTKDVSVALKQQLADVKVSLSLNNVIMKDSQPQTQIQPQLQSQPQVQPQTLQPTQIKPIEITINEIKTALQALSSEPTPNVAQTVEQIKSAIQSLPTTEIIGDVKLLGDTKQLVIKTPFGDIFPEQNIKLEPNAKLLLNIKEVILNRPIIEDLFSLSTAKTASNHSVLGSIIDILKPMQKPEHNILTNLIMNKIPAPNEKMLSNLVSYVKAASHSDLAAWLGPDIMEQLNNSGVEGKEALSKLNSLFALNNQDTPQWRIIEIPFFAGDTMSKIRVAIKKMQDDEENTEKEKKKGKSATRFVLDTSFTKLGKFQFDGFSIENEKRFDLIIRTERDFDEDFCSHVTRLFKKTLNDVAYSGNVYLNLKENFIKVCEDNSNCEILKDGIFI